MEISQIQSTPQDDTFTDFLKEKFRFQPILDFNNLYVCEKFAL